MNKLLVIVFLAAFSLVAAGKYQYAEVKVSSIDDIKFLQDNNIDIDRTSLGKGGKLKDGKITVYVTEDQYQMIEKNGYSMEWTPLQLPDKLTDFRHNTAIGDSMLIWQNRWPSICKRIQIGTSVQSRPLWVLRISDNVDVEEAEPEVKFVSTMHGDEVTGVEMELFFAENILKGYQANNDTMRFIVDNTELYIMPLMNPDGMENNSRYNANGYDLNRSFPNFLDGDPNSVSAASLPEIDAMIDFSNAHNFILSTNYHGGALVANYILDTLPPLTSGQYAAAPDDLHAIWLAANYAIRNTPMYNGSFTDGITNGLEWYEAVGGMQDWNYHYYDDMDITFEISNNKWPSFSEIPGFWEDNRESMFWYIMAAHKGIYGIVTDASTGLPLNATIEIAGIDKQYGTDPDFGDYYRILKPGIYSMTVSKIGYITHTINNIVVTDDTVNFKDATQVNVQLVPEGDIGGTFSSTPSSLDFGSLSAGYTSDLTFQISNTHPSEILTGTITTPSGYSVRENFKNIKDIKNTIGYTIGSGLSKTFTVTFEPAASQTYAGNIDITSSDPNDPSEAIAVTGTGITPDIDLNPVSLAASTTPETSVNRQFEVQNSDAGTLDYSININYTSKFSKASGGPDTYGYKWTDSDEAGGPVYSWVDITGSGSSVSLGDDAYSSALNLGFTCNFYGIDYTSVKICSNGFLSFTSTATAYTNGSIPSTATPNDILALFWDDLDPGSAGNIYYYSDGANGRFIVSYIGVPHFSSTSYNTGQVIINSNGTVVYQYQEVDTSTVNTCTVGIENAGGTDGSLVIKDAAYLKANLAIEFRAAPEWLSLNSTNGSIAGSGSDTITATLSAVGLEAGTYTADVIISSNDPDESTVTLPVTFTVADVLPADILLSVASISKTASPEGSVSGSFDIGNAGGSDLDYTITKEYSAQKADIIVESNDFTDGLGTYSNSGVLTWTSSGGQAGVIAGSSNASGILNTDTFDGTVCTSLTLTFDQVFTTQGQSDIFVEFFNGTSWTEIYTSGASTSVSQSLSLPVPAANMQVRFTGTMRRNTIDSWTIDNVVINGPATVPAYAWLTINSNLTGTLAPAGNDSINYTCDAAGLTEGTYNAEITVASNDPDEPSVIIPVAFIVSASITPDAPANLIVVNSNSSQIDLVWDAVSGASLYRIYRSTDPFSGFAEISSSGTNSYQDTGVTAGNKYFYYITADNAK